MSNSQKWTEDPVVLFEKAVLPLGAMVPLTVALHGVGHRVHADKLALQFKDAIAMLRDKAAEMLHKRQVTFTTDQFAPIVETADVLERLASAIDQHLAIPADQNTTSDMLQRLKSDLMPSLVFSADAYRAVFISFVLDKQQRHASQSKQAIETLDRISKQIFFISINASVEASRAGDVGLGFQQISTDIRALSQSAQDATKDLLGLVEGNGL